MCVLFVPNRKYAFDPTEYSIPAKYQHVFFHFTKQPIVSATLMLTCEYECELYSNPVTDRLAV